MTTSRRVQALAFVLALFIAGVARANVTAFKAMLSGDSESSSTATGLAEAVYDSVAHTLKVEVSFSGLEAGTTASHIHAATAVPLSGTAGVATTVPRFVGFPVGVTSGFYEHVLDLTSDSSYNPAYETAHGGTAAGAESALVAALFANESYLNVHTTKFPGGEIDGFLVKAADAPDEATTALLVGVGAMGLLGLARARRRRAS